MSKDNLLDFKAHVDRKDLEAWAQALFNQVNKLTLENQVLKDKLDHLEKLLKHAPVEIPKNKKGK